MWSMTGEWTGNLRSTPTWKLILRTVNVSGTADHDALEHLDTRTRAFNDVDVDLDVVSGAEVRDVAAK